MFIKSRLNAISILTGFILAVGSSAVGFCDTLAATKTGGSPAGYTAVPTDNSTVAASNQDLRTLAEQGKLDATALSQANVHGVSVDASADAPDLIVSAAASSSGKSSSVTGKPLKNTLQKCTISATVYGIAPFGATYPTGMETFVSNCDWYFVGDVIGTGNSRGYAVVTAITPVKKLLRQ